MLLNAFIRMFQPMPAPELKDVRPDWQSRPIVCERLVAEKLEVHPTRVPVEFIRMSATATMPRYASIGAAGMDLHADHDASIAVGEHKLILTNIAIKLPNPNLEAQVRSRSGLALKKGIMVLNSPGTIDSDYRGGIGVILYNAGEERFPVRQGDRIAQLVIAPVLQAQMLQVDAFEGATHRGAGSFGSTGV